jgi:LytS/YehU family sensor histidine kinase
METELKLLKTQISPHFLFNTLNNIYGLAYMKDDRAADMISKLSKIMRYLLDEGDQPSVSLAKERDLIEHYLSLQLLKHEAAKNVDFYHEGVQHRQRIVPMVLINFVENCFKHSDLETNSAAWIKISLEVEDNELHFVTENSVRKDLKETSLGRKGIGLANSLKLLEANYPNKHEVEINQTDQVYQLDLKLSLCV